jgi:chromosome segregation protein
MRDNPVTVLPGLESELTAARTALIEAETTAEGREHKRRSAQLALEEQRAQQATLASEHKGLLRLLAAAEPTFSSTPAALDQLSVAAGWEVAVARALGADAKLPLGGRGDARDENHWVLPQERSQPPVQTQVPVDAAALSSHVKAPPALARRLAHTFVVTDAVLAATTPNELASGVTIVTRSGAVLRWDGVRLGADENDGTAQVLAYRRRRTELEQQLRAAQNKTDAARTRLDAADDQLTAIRTAMRDARATISAREQQWRNTTKAAAAHADKVNSLRGRLAATEVEYRGLVDGDHSNGARLAELDQALATLPALAPLAETLATANQHRIDARKTEDDHRRTLELYRATRASLAKRHQALADARKRWFEERDEAGRDLRRLDTRAAEVTQQADSLHAAIAAAPDVTSLQTVASHADQRLDQTRASLSSAEQQARTADGQQRSCERAMAEARAARAAAEAHHGAAVAAVKEFSHDIEQRFGMQPEQLGSALKHAKAEMPTDAEPFPDDPAQLEPRLQRLLGQREALGAINLQAQAALAELQAQLGQLHKERDEVAEAVAVLRRGIADLNREASDRIDRAFKQINDHFEAMFTRLFGGGVARLTLTQPEDPLLTGLDIFAQPPGKKLQHLSLLSGGEQALTAMALIFAVFLTNPGPICILDEVDAPLDDANVERLCDLLADIESQTATRFLIITHHRLTMARMDRLFGVTMTEPGVSRLVSVDLAAAVQNAVESAAS